ncbi:MAG TPA: ABC transporter substrate-binding protein, partial [Candidatus Paceibacterota bacterium]|nr:ABC transporter substrate-binding protein [Candidatus Paceibacterota bacterium]
INHIATASEITTLYKERSKNYIFRIATLDKEQVRLFIAWAIKETNNGKIAVIYDSTVYGTQGLKDVTEVLARWGKTPVFTRAFDRGASVESLVGVMESTKEARADAIVFYSLADSTADLLKALDQVQDYDPVIVGTAANAVNLWDLAGPLAGKLVFTSPIGADFNERTMELNQKIIDKYGIAPSLLSSAASAYDAVYFLEAAIEQAGTLDRVAVRDALENLESVQGTMRLFVKPFSKQNHEALTVKDSFLTRWVNGKVTLIDEDVSDLEIR